MMASKFVRLPPFIREDVFSVMQARQHVGWGVASLDVPEIWKSTQGEGVTIAVIDTGVQADHPDLSVNLLPGFNAINRRKDPVDGSAHGTHVTGIIVADNNDIGMVGVAPKARVLPIKVLDDNGNGTLPNVAKGVMHAVKSKVDIICMSLGSPQRVPAVHKSIQAATSAGIAVFVAGGNAGKTKEVFYPAAYPETIAIGSIDEDFSRSDFSNTGNALDFMAPGGRIFSTVPGNWYAYMSGTSMAAPFAVGVYALLLSHCRHSLNVQAPRSPAEVREALRRGVRSVTSSPKNSKFYEGYGIIDPSVLFSALKTE